MTDTPLPIPQPNALNDAKGQTTQSGYRFLQSLEASLRSQSAGKASVSQSWEQSFFFEYPENKSYRMVVNSEIGRTITRLTTICTTGTATVKGQIDGVDLGGTANSVSTSEESQTHSSANVVHVGDNIAIVFSSVSGCENVSVTIAGTLTLA